MTFLILLVILLPSTAPSTMVANESSNKIQSAYFDKDLMKSILTKSPNISAISKKSLYTFDDRDILDW